MRVNEGADEDDQGKDQTGLPIWGEGEIACTLGTYLSEFFAPQSHTSDT